MERFKGSRLFLYNFSTAGHALFDTMLLFYAAKFFLPTAEAIEEGMIQFVPELILGFIPILGLLMVFGRIVDAVADPLIASWSDRSKSKLGRRRFFLIIGGLPLAVSTALVFFQPFPFTTVFNVIYSAIVFGLFFLFYTVYVAPYVALIPELGHSEKERLNMTTAQGYFALIGAGLVMIGGPMLYDIFLKTGNPTTAFKLMAVILCAIGAVLLYLAVFAVNEKKYSDAKPSSVSFWDSLKKTIKSRPFIIFLIANMCFWFMFNTLRSSVNHIGETLMVVSEDSIGMASVIIFVGAAAFFPLVLFLSRKIGKKIVMIAGLGFFAFFSVLISFTGISINPEGLTCNYVTTVTSSQDSTIWIGTARGISTVKDKNWEYFNKDSGLSDNSITTSLTLADGSLWFGTKKGISVNSAGSWSSFNTEDGLPDSHVTCLAVDEAGTVWCGTKNGLANYKQGSWQSFSQNDGLINNNITTLALAAEGIIWIGTEQGLSSYNGSTWQSYKKEDGLSNNSITALAVAGDDELWCGTAAGLCYFNGSSWKTYTKDHGLPDNRVSALALAPDGVLWVGTKGGLCTFKGESCDSSKTKDLPQEYISSLLILNNKDVWIGTQTGVLYLKTGQENATLYSNTGPLIWALVIFALFGFSVAVLLMVPNVFISDLCDFDFKKTKEHREGMYFGVHGFFMKLNLGISFLLMSFFYSVFGKDIANPLGVRLACIAVSVIGILGIIVFLKYPDKLVKGISAQEK